MLTWLCWTLWQDRIFIEFYQDQWRELRRIAQDPDVKATALDFELLQSVGQQTFDNMRPFFSGVIKGKR